MEVASLVLAVVPLIIAAAENYEVTFQPFVTYHRYLKEVERFTGKLRAQHTVFYNECQLLLFEVGQDLAQILEDPQHPSRTNKKLSGRLEELLGNSHQACISTLTLINSTLEEVTEETKGFHDLLDPKKAKQKRKLSILRQKLKISFSKTRLNEIIDELRNYNADLHRLSSQIQKLQSNVLRSPVTANSAVLSHLKITQQASHRLYDSLASEWSCGDQVRHIASMDLRVEDRCKDPSSQVGFSLGIACWKTAAQQPRLWLSFESASSGQSHNTPPDRNSDLEVALVKKMGVAPRVHFGLPTIKEDMLTRSVGRTLPVQPPQLDLCSKGSLCNYFRQLLTSPIDEPCLGVLAEIDTFKHVVYQMPIAQVPATTTNPNSLSLKDVLNANAMQHKQEDWVAKLKPARLLTLSVLRFYETPWLARTWSSKDIHFFKRNRQRPDHNLLEAPYLNATLLDRRDYGSSLGTSESLATNPELHSLGVILLELANDRPFEMLCHSESHPIDITNKTMRDFFTARRLAEKVHHKFNMTYAAIVEKCLNCSFGAATKLKETELQSAILVHVVHQLDVCLDQYARFSSQVPVPLL